MIVGLISAALDLIQSRYAVIPYFIQIGPPVFPIQHAAGLAMLLEQFQVEVFEDHHFDVGRAFGSDGIPLEGNIGRREHGGLRVVQSHGRHVGQIADAPGNGDIDVVFDAPRLGAIAHPQVGVPFVRAKRHEDDLRALLGGDARQLREFNVITNLDGDLAFVRYQPPSWLPC